MSIKNKNKIEINKTASELAKSNGLKSLNQVKELTGVSIQTLINWHNNKSKLFKVVLLGCYAQIGKSI